MNKQKTTFPCYYLKYIRWHDCCVSVHPDSLRCGKPEVEDGNEKMRMLIQSEEVQKILSIITG